jgi:hypothetical protein
MADIDHAVRELTGASPERLFIVGLADILKKIGNEPF